MGRKVFLSFLGIGQYSEVEYTLNNKKLKRTKFVQKAEIEYYGDTFFDKIFISVTKSSKDRYFDELSNSLPGNIEYILISEDLSPASQWEGFEKIIEKIQTKDELYIDLTHGFRSIPIMFSIAINFLQQMKNIELKAVYYGVNEKKDKPIIDIKEFFIINRWADAVSRLIENADAKKIVSIPNELNDFKIANLNDPDIIESFNKLTDAIRNVDINNISKIATNTIKKVKERIENVFSKTEKMLLEVVIDKFTILASEKNISEEYNDNYFKMQIEIINVLLEHKLYMQAFTAMREFIVSLVDAEALLQIEKHNTLDNKNKKRFKKNSRKRLADPFIGMLLYEENKWDFRKEYDKEGNKYLSIMKPIYDKFKENEVFFNNLKTLVKELIPYRNGFDHAWISQRVSSENASENGSTFFNKLKEIYKLYLEYKKNEL